MNERADPLSLSLKEPIIPGSVIVLGAGVAGLAASKALTSAGLSVTVIEQADQCGGAHRSREIGPYTFDVGSIFYENGAAIFGLAPDLQDLCPEVTKVESRIGPDGTLLHYPIELRELRNWPNARKVRALADLLASRAFSRRNGTLEAACVSRLGRTIYRDTGLASYIERFHHHEPFDIDEEFFFKRMAYVERMTRMRSMLATAWRATRRQPLHSGPWPPLRVRPPGGMRLLFGPIQRALEDRSVRFRLRERLLRVEAVEGGFAVTTTAGRYLAEALVSAIPLDTLHRAVFGTDTGLRSLNLLTLFVLVAWLDPAAGNVLFNFHPAGRWKRATIYSRLYPERQAPREFLSVEVTLPPGWAPDPETAFADFKAHVEELGIVRDARLEGHEVVEAAYPLYRPGDVARASAAIEGLERLGIVSVGRQGRFEYLPVSSEVIWRVQEELDRSGPSRRPADA